MINMKKVNMRYVAYGMYAVWVVSFVVAYGLLLTGCSNGGEFARTDKKAGAEPTVVAADPVVITLPEEHTAEDCDTCCYTLEEFHAALSACKAARKKDHVICVYDYLFDNHDHEGED